MMKLAQLRGRGTLRPLPFGAGGDTVTARAPQASDRVAQARPPGAPRRVAHAMLGAAVRSTGSLIDLEKKQCQTSTCESKFGKFSPMFFDVCCMMML